MDQSNINLTALRSFLSVLSLGLVSYVAVVIGARFVSPARRYAARLIGMSVITLIWYAYFLPDFADAHGGPAWGPEVGSGPWLYGHRCGIHSIWLWVVAAAICKPKAVTNAQSTG